MRIELHNGEALEVLKTYPDNYFDSIVTDPPYGISFMSKKWDYDVPSVGIWKEILRVLKPGGHVLCACGTRTQHRMVVNIEDAGFEIRDVITWHYGSGYPKSMNISLKIDDKFGAEREVVGQREDILKKQAKDLREGKRKIVDSLNSGSPERNNGFSTASADITAPSTKEAMKFMGWGTALKPATEFWTLARKPIQEKTVVDNVLKYGTGGINIDATRISTDEIITNHSRGNESAVSKGKYGDSKAQDTHQTSGQKQGRFPANVIFDDFTGMLLDEQTGELKGGTSNGNAEIGEYSEGVVKSMRRGTLISRDDIGGASRFFYCAKPSKAERDKGLGGLDFKKDIGHNRFDKCKNCGGLILQNPDRPSACKCENPERENNIVKGNYHPTVKPLKLMSYLVKLVTPPGGIVLDPFNGSGTTGIACKIEGFSYVGIEREKEYCDITEARIKAWDVTKTPDEQLELF